MKNLPNGFKRFFYLMVSLALLILVVASVQMTWSTNELIHLLVFSVLAVTSESLPVALPKGGYVTVGFALFFAALILFPFGVACVVAALAALLVCGEAAKDQPLFKRLFNASQYVVSVTVASFFLSIFHVQTFRLTGIHLLAYCTAAVAYLVVNVTMVAIALGTMQGKSPWSIWGSNIRWATPNFLALAPLALLIALVYQNFEWVGLVLLFIPLLLSRHSFRLYVDMRENYLNTIEALVQALEAKDPYTSGHSDRVAKFAVAIAEKLGMTEEQVEFIKYAAVLHDVGKIGVSENILNKKDQLSQADWVCIHNHPVIGQNIIKNIKFLFDIGPVVRHHHERYDGKGYPDGLAMEQIPLAARIIAIADTYDAMTSDRSYRKGKTPLEALREIKMVAGSQLDPQLVGIFSEIMSPDIQVISACGSQSVELA